MVVSGRPVFGPGCLPGGHHRRVTTTKTAPRKAAKAPAVKLEAIPPAGPKPAKPGTIVFRGRTIRVNKPTESQLAVWQRIANRYADLDPAKDQSKAGEILNRYFVIVESVLADTADRDWVEDHLLGGDMDLTEMAQIVTKTVDHYYGAKVPKTGPAPKARRRA